MERSDVVISLKRLVRVVHANWGPTLREAIALLSTPEPPDAEGEETAEAELAHLRQAPRVGVDAVLERLRKVTFGWGRRSKRFSPVMRFDDAERILRECWPAAGKGEPT